MTMTATSANGKARRQLSDEIDRLQELLARQDSLLDGLAEGLNEAVAAAAKDGVKEAVAGAVVELLTNLDLRAALHKATAPPAAARPSAWDRLMGAVRRGVERARAAAAAARRAAANRAAVVRVAAAGAAALAGAA